MASFTLTVNGRKVTSGLMSFGSVSRPAIVFGVCWRSV